MNGSDSEFGTDESLDPEESSRSKVSSDNLDMESSDAAEDWFAEARATAARNLADIERDFPNLIARNDPAIIELRIMAELQKGLIDGAETLRVLDTIEKFKTDAVIFDELWGDQVFGADWKTQGNNRSMNPALLFREQEAASAATLGGTPLPVWEVLDVWKRVRNFSTALAAGAFKPENEEVTVNNQEANIAALCEAIEKVLPLEQRLTGHLTAPEHVEWRRSLNTLRGELNYLKGDAKPSGKEMPDALDKLRAAEKTIHEHITNLRQMLSAFDVKEVEADFAASEGQSYRHELFKEQGKLVDVLGQPRIPSEYQAKYVEWFGHYMSEDFISAFVTLELDLRGEIDREREEDRPLAWWKLIFREQSEDLVNAKPIDLEESEKQIQEALSVRNDLDVAFTGASATGTTVPRKVVVTKLVQLACVAFQQGVFEKFSDENNAVLRPHVAAVFEEKKNLLEQNQDALIADLAQTLTSTELTNLKRLHEQDKHRAKKVGNFPFNMPQDWDDLRPIVRGEKESQASGSSQSKKRLLKEPKKFKEPDAPRTSVSEPKIKFNELKDFGDVVSEVEVVGGVERLKRIKQTIPFEPSDPRRFIDDYDHHYYPINGSRLNSATSGKKEPLKAENEERVTTWESDPKLPKIKGPSTPAYASREPTPEPSHSASRLPGDQGTIEASTSSSALVSSSAMEVEEKRRKDKGKAKEEVPPDIEDVTMRPASPPPISLKRSAEDDSATPDDESKKDFIGLYDGLRSEGTTKYEAGLQAIKAIENKKYILPTWVNYGEKLHNPIPVGRLNDDNQTFVFVKGGGNLDGASRVSLYLCPPEMLPSSITADKIDTMIRSDGEKALSKKENLATFAARRVPELDAYKDSLDLRPAKKAKTEEPAGPSIRRRL